MTLDASSILPWLNISLSGESVFRTLVMLNNAAYLDDGDLTRSVLTTVDAAFESSTVQEVLHNFELWRKLGCIFKLSSAIHNLKLFGIISELDDEPRANCEVIAPPQDETNCENSPVSWVVSNDTNSSPVDLENETLTLISTAFVIPATELISIYRGGGLTSLRMLIYALSRRLALDYQNYSVALSLSNSLNGLNNTLKNEFPALARNLDEARDQFSQLETEDQTTMIIGQLLESLGSATFFELQNINASVPEILECNLQINSAQRSIQSTGVGGCSGYLDASTVRSLFSQYPKIVSGGIDNVNRCSGCVATNVAIITIFPWFRGRKITIGDNGVFIVEQGMYTEMPSSELVAAVDLAVSLFDPNMTYWELLEVSDSLTFTPSECERALYYVTNFDPSDSKCVYSYLICGLSYEINTGRSLKMREAHSLLGPSVLNRSLVSVGYKDGRLVNLLKAMSNSYFVEMQTSPTPPQICTSEYSLYGRIDFSDASTLAEVGRHLLGQRLSINSTKALRAALRSFPPTEMMLARKVDSTNSLQISPIDLSLPTLPSLIDQTKDVRLESAPNIIRALISNWPTKFVIINAPYLTDCARSRNWMNILQLVYTTCSGS